jgi:hypothetical protein
MKISKYFLLAAALVLVGVLCSGATAQVKMGPTSPPIWLPPEPIMDIVSVNAIEISDGTLGFNSETKKETSFGYSFLGQTTGSLPGSFTLSMNCTPATPIPGDTSELTGGAWSLPVYMLSIRGSGYAGSLYGTIAKGTMNWDKTGTNADIYIVLNVNGGTQSWENVQGYATFAGTLFVDEKTQKTMLNGNMVFTIISGIPDQR